MDWSGVDYCDVFIRLSFWRHPFTAESIAETLITFSKSDEENKLIYIGRPKGEKRFSKFEFLGELFF